MYCKRFLIKYFLNRTSVLFVYIGKFLYKRKSWKDFIKTFRSVVPEAIIPFNCSERFLINNGLEEGRTHQDSNLDYRIQSPMCLPLHHKSFTLYKVNV